MVALLTGACCGIFDKKHLEKAISFVNKRYQNDLINLVRAHSVHLINEIIPSGEHYNITQKLNDYVTFNPSIAVDQDGKLMITATQTNRLWKKNRKSSIISGTKFKSQIVLMKVLDDLRIENVSILDGSQNFIGYELSDARLFKIDSLWYISTSINYSSSCKGECCISISTINEKLASINDIRVIDSPFDSSLEKNWMPICDDKINEIRFIYSVSPTIVVEIKNHKAIVISESEGPDEIISARGGSQAVTVDDNKWLSVVHHTYEFDRRYYTHRFVVYEWLDGKYVIRGYSKSFSFNTQRDVEFAAGLAVSNNKLYISYGYRDNEAWVFCANLDDVMKLIVPWEKHTSRY